MANPFGRGVIIPLTNQSGGSVAAGDVVVVDTTHNDSFTTSTAGSVSNTGIGVAQQTIANGAIGLVAITGYVSLVNVNASVTRGNYGKTFTVAKQATDAGATRVAGTFCQFLTGGTTPDAYIYQPDLGGASLTNPMTTGGDIIYGGASGVPTRLANGSAGQELRSAGTTAAPTWAYPPGYEFDYVQITSPASITATSEATANTVVTGTAIAYDGSTTIMIEFYSPEFQPSNVAGRIMAIILYDGASSIGFMGIVDSVTTTAANTPIHVVRRLTPAAATKTYSIRCYVSAGTGTVGAGAGGAAADMPAFIRQYKV